MIVHPILIVGAPRSGTSLLQKILRGHPGLWSLVSESEHIWEHHCSPALRDWHSDVMTAEEITEEARQYILREFERMAGPAWLFRSLEKTGLVWGFRRRSRIRRVLRPIYLSGFPLLSSILRKPNKTRLVEKTAGNCLRLGYVNEIFPDARIIYPTRHGYNNVSSLINAWLDPSRFFSYSLPVELRIKGYPYEEWNFVLPAGWRDYVERPLQDVCAFQWRACHEAILKEIKKPKYDGRVLQVKLEELARDPETWLRKITDFTSLPYDRYFRRLARDLPIINSPDGDTTEDKWTRQNRSLIEDVMPTIDPMLGQLGY